MNAIRILSACGCALILCTGLIRNVHAESPSDGEAGNGHALFVGKEDLKGRIAGHPAELPPNVIRCANCHAVGAGPEVKGSFAPRLTGEGLTGWQKRRGGPSSHFDLDTFCVLLRQGVDPAYVVLSIEMPRYEIDDKQCRELWRYLAKE